MRETYHEPVRVPVERLIGELTEVRAASASDADLLVDWHASPEVSRYWDGETFTRDEMLARLARDDVDASIVEAEGEPVGYLQAWFEPGTDDGGLDMFLVPEARGRGLGSDAARTLADWLLGTGAVRRLTVDPYHWNAAAIRAWTRAGFRSVETRDADADHTDPWLLMVLDAQKRGIVHGAS